MIGRLVGAFLILIWILAKAILAWKKFKRAEYAGKRFEIVADFSFDIFLLYMAIMLLLKMDT